MRAKLFPQPVVFRRVATLPLEEGDFIAHMWNQDGAVLAGTDRGRLFCITKPKPPKRKLIVTEIPRTAK